MEVDAGSAGSRERTNPPPGGPGGSTGPDDSLDLDTSGSTSAAPAATARPNARSGSTRLRNRASGNSVSSASAPTTRPGAPPGRSTSAGAARGSTKPPSTGAVSAAAGSKKRTASGNSKDVSTTGSRRGTTSSRRSAKMLTDEPLNSASEEDEEDEDESVTRCVCGRNGDDAVTGLMFQCEECNVWQHGPCVGLTGDIQGDYYCERCRPDLHVNGSFQTRIRPAPHTHRRSPSTSHSHSHSLSHPPSRRERQATQDAVKLSKFLEEAGVPEEMMGELGGFAMPIAHTRRATLDAAKSAAAAGGSGARDVFSSLQSSTKSERDRDRERESASADLVSEFEARQRSRSAKDKSPSPAGSGAGNAASEGRGKRKRMSEDGGEQLSPQSVESPLGTSHFLEKGKRRRVSPIDPLLSAIPANTSTGANGAGAVQAPSSAGVSPAGSAELKPALGPAPLGMGMAGTNEDAGGVGAAEAGGNGNVSAGSGSGSGGSSNGQAAPRKASAPVITTAPMVTAPTSKPKHPNQYTYRPLDPNRKKDVVIKKVSPIKRVVPPYPASSGNNGGVGLGGGGYGSAGLSPAGGSGTSSGAATERVSIPTGQPSGGGGVERSTGGGGGGGRGKSSSHHHRRDERETTPLDGGGWGMPEFLSHLSHLLPGPSPKPISVPVPKSTAKKAAAAAAAAMAEAEEEGSPTDDRMVIDGVNGATATATENGISQIVAAELPTQLEAACRVRFPGKRMTMPDMRKRAKHLVDYLGRIQADQHEIRRRNKCLADAGVVGGAAMAPGVSGETVRLMEELGAEIQGWQERFGA